MTICAAVGCKSSSSSKPPKPSLHRLPREKSLKSQWLQNLKRKNLPKEENVRVCHLHFEECCFERDLQNEMLGKPIRRILKNGAVPTIFVNSSIATKRRSSSRRKELNKRKNLIKNALTNGRKQRVDEYGNNSKGIQVNCSPLLVDVSTQTT